MMAKKLKKLLLPELKNWRLIRAPNVGIIDIDPSHLRKLRADISDDKDYQWAVARESVFHGELRIDETLRRSLTQREQSFERLLDSLERRTETRLREIWPAEAVSQVTDEHFAAAGILRAVRDLRRLRQEDIGVEWLAFQLGRLVGHALRDDVDAGRRSNGGKKAGPVKSKARARLDDKDKPEYQAKVEEFTVRDYPYGKACEQTAKHFRRKDDQKRQHSRRVRDLTKNPRRKTRKRTDA
jgi:hypothetical protein